MENKIRELQEELKKTKSELWLLHQVGSIMRTSLNLPEVLYVILSAVTSHEGLGFNRAMLFLISKNRRFLEGRMAIGPTTAEEAHYIWKRIADEKLGLEKIAEMFHAIDNHVLKTPINNMVTQICLPLKEESGVFAMCALEGMTFEITTPQARENIKDPLLAQLSLDSFACVALKGKKQVEGVLVVDNKITQRPITKDDMRVLTMFADQAGLAIENSYLYEHTKFRAHTDSLTRLWNHGYFQDTLSRLIRTTPGPIALAMIDLDNFKAYNDLLGHQKGDVALRQAAYILKRKTRPDDIVCRYGGEEFAIIMPGISKNDAVSVTERLRLTIEEIFKRSKKKESFPPLTISAGIASYPDDASSKEDLIQKADQALYKAKKIGKNKVVAC